MLNVLCFSTQWSVQRNPNLGHLVTETDHRVTQVTKIGHQVADLDHQTEGASPPRTSRRDIPAAAGAPSRSSTQKDASPHRTNRKDIPSAAGAPDAGTSDKDRYAGHESRDKTFEYSRVLPEYFHQPLQYGPYPVPSFYPPPPPPPLQMPSSLQMPQWGYSVDDPDEEETDDFYEQNEDTGNDEQGKEEETDSFESMVREFEAEPSGEPLSEAVANAVNKIWRKHKESEGFKKAAKRAKKPENVATNRLQVNDELFSVMSAGSKAYDGRLKAIQSMLCKAAIPAARLLDKVQSEKIKLNKADEKVAERELIDTISLIAHTNNTVNFQRREAIKRRLPPHYNLALKAPEKPSTTLFGEECSEQLKKAGYGSKMKRDVRQYQLHMRENQDGYRPTRRRGRGTDRGRGNRMRPYPYSTRGGRGVPFLGKEHSTAYSSVKILSTECTRNWSTHIDLSCYRVPPGQPVAADESDTDESGSPKSEQEEVEHVTLVGQYLTLQYLQTIVDQPFRAGQLATKAVEWRKLTSDPEVLQNIRNYHIELREIPMQNNVPGLYNLSEWEKVHANKEIQDLLRKGVISVVDHVEGEYISNVFFREKRNSDKLRMILNIKKLNEYVVHEHFKMDTLRTALQLVEEGDWFISIDFSDAYYSIPVVEGHRKYLRFRFEGVLYEYNVVPNGLTTGPRLFTKILKVPLSVLRQWFGFRIVGYLDDTLIMAKSNKLVDEQAVEAAKLFTKLGFHINQKKSSVVPSQKVEYLGVEIDSQSMKVRLTRDKASRLLEFILDFRKKQHYTVRDAAGLIGKLLATEPANPWALLFTKRMETEKSHALRSAQGNFDAPMTFTDWALKDLDWWEQNILKLWAPVRRSNPDKIIYTDASKKGWGWARRDTNEQGGGRWNQEETELHINVLELKAVYLSLRSLCKEDSHIHIRIMSDNSTTVANINKQGSVKSAPCDRMARYIWQFALERNIWLSAAHCPGATNVEADLASRIFNDGSEWALSERVFQSICSSFEIVPTVDMFASRLNTKLQTYIAWQPDPDAWAIDAFTINWNTVTGFYFPPFNVIGRVLEKLEADKAMGIVIVPCWPSQTWFTKYVEMSSSDIFYFDIFLENLFLPFRTKQQHNLAGKTKLLVTTCTSKDYKKRDFQTRPSKSCQHHDAGLPQNCIKVTSTDGLHFVRRGELYRPKELCIKG